MIERMKNSEGFTLAELLLSIAIILALSAIAVPSVVNAQNNMRMVELDNAAQAVANAAQAHMTAMKVSGTWLALVEQADGRVKYPAAKSGGDAYYMVASSSEDLQGARDNGIVSGLSIDESVRSGDYVIVFNAATASVVEVFYADGKSGFFGDAPASTSAAQVYYIGGGSSDQGVRMQNDPMIGYYAGTPVGATPEAALRNPVIWVDEGTGRLMIQDPNIAEDGKSGTTTSTVLVKNETANVSFILSSLSSETDTLYVSTEDGGDELVLSGASVADVMKQVRRDASDLGNVFSIDLNTLANKVATSGESAVGNTVGRMEAADDASSERLALKAVFAACAPGDNLTVQVETKDMTRSSVPAKANAAIEWPDPLGMLALLVTNPHSAALAKDVSAAYTEPVVRATDPKRNDPENGMKSIALYENDQNYLRDTEANRVLVAENKQAGYQSYAGGWIPSSVALADETLRLEATVGSYRAQAYQIWELWIKRGDNGDMVRVGYLNDDVWEWAAFSQNGISYDYSFLDTCLTWYDDEGNAYASIAGIDTDAANINAVSLNANALLAAEGGNAEGTLVDENGSATIYVRTAPKTSKVHEYFDGLAVVDKAEASNDAENDGAKGFGSYLNENVTELSSRSTSSDSAAARKDFEEAFGVSSSDVSWVLSSERTAGFEQGDSYLLDEACQNVRAYYTIAPAVGFENIRNYNRTNDSEYLTGVRSTRLTNVSLWLYRGATLDSLQAMPSASLWNKDGVFEFACQQVDGGNDFKLSTKEDYRFYRVLTYYDKTGETKLDIPDQYVPHAVAEEAVISGAGNVDNGDTIGVFDCWLTEEGVTCAPGALGSCLGRLDMKGTKFKAQYVSQPKAVGLMYLEFDADGNVSGYSGYLGDEETHTQINTLSNTDKLASWGYYVVVPAGAARPTGTMKTDASPVSLDVHGLKYDAYRIGNADDNQKKANQVVTWTSSSDLWTKSATFCVNFNFAAAIAKGDDADSLGGVGNPYIVRHGTQFPLALKANGGAESVQLKYMGACFRQTRSIDLTGLLSSDYAYRPNNAFIGNYDGGNDQGFVITGLSSRYVGEFNHRQGLFPIVRGATLRNISVSIENDINVLWNSGIDAAFGCLAGIALDSDIQNCQVVSGMPDGSAPTITISNLSPKGGRHPDSGNEGNNIGGLVGYANNTNIDASSLSGIKLCVQSASGAWTVGSIRLGLLIGKLDAQGSAGSAVSYQALTVANAVLSDEGLSTETPQSMGGIVGQVVFSGDGKVTASNWKASKITLKAVETQERDKLLVGGFIGEAAGSCDLLTSACDKDVVLAIPGLESEPLVDLPIGKHVG